ncbi:MAG: hypothetical protein PHV54_08250, partial [Tolumonas sp.]|nr:hypothetical protein [Tolumonas sp.]
PYLDTNNTGAYASGKSFVDLNKDSVWSDYDGVYHGLACDDTLVNAGKCDRHTIQMYGNHEFIFSSIKDNSGFFVEQWNGSKWVKATSPLDVSVVGYYRFLPVNIATDGKTYNPLPSGAKISVATTNGGDISNGMPGGFIPGTPAQESDTYNAYINNYPSIHPGDKTGPIDLSISADISGSTDVGATRPYYFYFVVKPEETPNGKKTGILTISATTASSASTGAGGTIKIPFDANDKG